MLRGEMRIDFLEEQSDEDEVDREIEEKVGAATKIGFSRS